MGLDLRVNCNTPDAQQFVVFVNPDGMSSSGKLFTDLFPIAWKVLRFSPARNQNNEVRLSFSTERTVGLASLLNGNEVVAGWTSAVGDRKDNWFKTQENEGAYKLVLNDTPNADVSARVSNVVGKKMSIFFGDKSGTPFMYQDVRSGETSSFVEKTKIVIVAVRGYKETEVIKSDIMGSWLEFNVEDTQGSAREDKFYIEYTKDGKYELYSNNGVPFQQYASNVPVFQGSKAKDSATLGDIKAMEVEV
ncbi:hypothetical protein BG003_011755 [Podila horticola]|nr:hypothetical protein BG003_011755 [Podila horticola]